MTEPWPGVEHVPSDDDEAQRVAAAEEAEEALDAEEDHPFKRKRKKEQTGNVEVRGQSHLAWRTT